MKSAEECLIHLRLVGPEAEAFNRLCDEEARRPVDEVRRLIRLDLKVHAIRIEEETKAGEEGEP